MRQLRINLSDLEIAFDSGGEMISHHYLDTETGEIISVTDDEHRLLESIYESYYDAQTQTVDWEAAFQKERVPEWQPKRMRDADRAEAGFGSRFTRMMQKPDHVRSTGQNFTFELDKDI